MRRLTLKSSTVLVSVGDETHSFRSVEEMPLPLRQRLTKSTNGANSATILIADKKGREELLRVLRRFPGLTGSAAGSGARPGALRWRSRRISLRALRLGLEAATVCLLAIVVWLIFIGQ